MDPLQFNWVVSPSHIKEEHGELVSSLLSPPATPSPFVLSSTSPGHPPRRLPRTSPPSPSASGRIRPRPYPLTRPVLQGDIYLASQSTHRMQWNSTSSSGARRSVSGSGRRPSDAERNAPYGNAAMDTFIMPPSASESTLLGAMGGSSDAQYPRLYSNDMGWNEMPMLSGNAESSYQTTVPSHFSGLQTPSGYESTDLARNVSPESLDTNSSSCYPPGQDGYVMVGGRTYRTSSSSSGSRSPYQREDPETEIRRLRKRVKDLEAIVVTTPVASAPANVSPAFRQSWKRRTEAREKIYCSLNRAGNALCAWHDSRRERRKYPPRNAPPGVLNCGCTHEEALFEESLARHAVGGYLPGASVRMDPELRGPLLRLLQKRYGYKDGDFDYDPQTMQWHDDQDPESWERQAHSGSSVRTRRADHSERH